MQLIPILALAAQTQTDPWAVNWPTVILSAGVALATSLITSTTQRKIAQSAQKHAIEQREREDCAVARRALIAYERALGDAAESWETEQLGGHSPRFPENLQDLRDDAYPHFRDLLTSAPETFRLLSNPGGGEDVHTSLDAAQEFRLARDEIQRLVERLDRKNIL